MGTKSRHFSLDLTGKMTRRDFVSNFNRTSSASLHSAVAENAKLLFNKLDRLDEPDELETESKQVDLSNQYYHIRKDHWIDSKSVNKCSICAKQFGFALKKYNCRRCGQVFCDQCCHYKRRLSKFAEPDVNGNLYRVCYNCAELNIQTVGQTRSLTTFFNEQRKKRRVNVLNELDRLLEEFKRNIKSSRLKSYTAETISLVKVLNWQKSGNWLASSEVEWCSNCATKFTYLMQKHHCRICGVVVCSKCSNQDLMLYYDTKNNAYWTLIKVVGCPDSEPSLCWYLSICNPCREEVEEVQVQRFYGDSFDGMGTSAMEKLQSVLKILHGLEEMITTTLPRYQELVDGIMDGEKLNDIASLGQNVVLTFAKLQLDLADFFTEYSLTTQGLRKLQMASRTEIKIMKNVIDHKYSFYVKNSTLFKSLKESLSKELPTNALQEVQEYSNKQSINNACIIIKQLGYEALLLADTYGFEPVIAAKLSEVAQVCTRDLKGVISASGENWDEHDKHMKEMLRLQLSKHKFVKLPKLSKNRNKADYVNKCLVDRCAPLVTQTLEALKAKSVQKKFLESKDAMKSLLDHLQLIQLENRKWTIPDNE